MDFCDGDGREKGVCHGGPTVISVLLRILKTRNFGQSTPQQYDGGGKKNLFSEKSRYKGFDCFIIAIVVRTRPYTDISESGE